MASIKRRHKMYCSNLYDLGSLESCSGKLKNLKDLLALLLLLLHKICTCAISNQHMAALDAGICATPPKRH